MHPVGAHPSADPLQMFTQTAARIAPARRHEGTGDREWEVVAPHATLAVAARPAAPMRVRGRFRQSAGRSRESGLRLRRRRLGEARRQDDVFDSASGQVDDVRPDEVRIQHRGRRHRGLGLARHLGECLHAPGADPSDLPGGRQFPRRCRARANVDLECSGRTRTSQVDASGFVLVLQIQDSSGNTYTMMSTGDPKSDTGAQDRNGNALPQKNNNSTISLESARRGAASPGNSCGRGLAGEASSCSGGSRVLVAMSTRTS